MTDIYDVPQPGSTPWRERLATAARAMLDIRSPSLSLIEAHEEIARLRAVIDRLQSSDSRLPLTDAEAFELINGKDES